MTAHCRLSPNSYNAVRGKRRSHPDTAEIECCDNARLSQQEIGGSRAPIWDAPFLTIIGRRQTSNNPCAQRKVLHSWGRAAAGYCC